MAENVRIIQCLCPARHCIAALAFVPSGDERRRVEGFRAQLEAAMLAGRLDPRCGLCGSRDWYYEVGITRFATLEEARPFLEESEAQQRLTRRLFGRRRRASGGPPPPVDDA